MVCIVCPIAAARTNWSHSSVGQSVRLITVRSAVRARVGPYCFRVCNSNEYDPGRTRTCNPRLRRPMPYPLGHGARCVSHTCHVSTCCNKMQVPAWKHACLRCVLLKNIWYIFFACFLNEEYGSGHLMVRFAITFETLTLECRCSGTNALHY